MCHIGAQVSVSLIEEVCRQRFDPMLHSRLHLIIAAESFCRLKSPLVEKKMKVTRCKVGDTRWVFEDFPLQLACSGSHFDHHGH
jgi:hypothetical protein